MRQVHSESRARLFRGFHVDSAMVSGGYGTCYVQTKSETFGSTGSIFSLLHWLKDAAHFRLRDRNAIIVDGYSNFVGFPDCLDFHRLLASSMPYGVLHEV